MRTFNHFMSIFDGTRPDTRVLKSEEIEIGTSTFVLLVLAGILESFLTLPNDLLSTIRCVIVWGLYILYK